VTDSEAEAAWEQLQPLAPQVDFIGETGLDRLRPHPRHADFFLRHLRLAIRLEKPVVLHVVQHHGLALDLLDQVQYGQKGASGLVHSFSADPTTAKKYIARGLKISLGPQIMNPAFKKARATAAEIVSDCLLVESDQDQNPTTKLLESVYEAIGRLRSVPCVELSQQVLQNWHNMLSRSRSSF
jgi:Tat protein secretion system quality control protein TatD with DNase activity